MVGRADEEYSCIEVKGNLVAVYLLAEMSIIVYNEATHHSYSHHEIMLNTYPLCLEWMDYNTAKPDKNGTEDIQIFATRL